MKIIQLPKKITPNAINELPQSILEDETNVSYEDYINNLPIKYLSNYVHKFEIDSLNFDSLNPDIRKVLIKIRNTNKKPREVASY